MSTEAVRDERSAEFFDALADGRLLLRRCVPHGHVSAPEVMFCAECASADLDWSPARGDAEIVSWTAIHSRPDESGATHVHSHVALVELAEGPWLLARLLVDDGAEVTPGAHVTLDVVRAGEPVYAFRIAASPVAG
jgi:uncharacterized OB-fold protein